MNKYHKIFNRSTRRTGGPSPRTAPRVLRTAGTADCGPAAQHWKQVNRSAVWDWALFSIYYELVIVFSFCRQHVYNICRHKAAVCPVDV